jgi:hypothetical protein
VGDSPAVGPRTDIVLSVGILALCGLGWLATDALPLGLRLDPLGPAYFPRFVLICLAALATALLVNSAWVLRRGAADRSATASEPVATPDGPEQAADEEAGWDAAPISYPRMLGVLALSLGYVLLMDALGYLVSSGLYVVLLLLLLRVRWPLAIALCAIGLPAVLFALFGWLLGVPLPGGVLEALRPGG